MATYKQVAQLVLEGKSPSEIIHALNIYPSRLAQIFKRPRFKQFLQTDLMLADALGTFARLAAAGDVTVQLAKLSSSDNEKVALQASLTILRQLDKPPRGATRRAMAALEMNNPPPVEISLGDPPSRLFRTRRAERAGSVSDGANHVGILQNPSETEQISTSPASTVENCRAL
jgi:hypothetical protein